MMVVMYGPGSGLVYHVHGLGLEAKVTGLGLGLLFYAYVPMLLCDCQSFIKESYLLTYLHDEFMCRVSLKSPSETTYRYAEQVLRDGRT